MPSPIVVTTVRVKPGQFVNGTYPIVLDHAIAPDFFVRHIRGSNSVGARANEANEADCRIGGSPSGSLAVQTAADTLLLVRDDASPASDLEIVLQVVECTDPDHPDGFKSRGEYEITLGAGTGLGSLPHAGVVDPAKCQAFLGGSQCASTATFQRNSGKVRLRHTATDVEAERLRTDTQAIVTAFLIEWNANTTVQLVEFLDAAMPAGGDLDVEGDWSTVPISSVESVRSFVEASFAGGGASSPSSSPDAMAAVLGNGVGFATNETTVAVGSQAGGNLRGWIYVATNPNWYVGRTIFANGALVGAGVTSADFAIPPPSGAETYPSTATEDRAVGPRSFSFWASVQAEFTSEFRLAQHVVIPTSPIVASYHRQIADKPAPYGDGVAVYEQVDFGGDPFGDPNDIDGTTSTAELIRSDSLVAGHESTKVFVTVRDSASKPVPGVDVGLVVGLQPAQAATADANGVAEFTVSSALAGTLSLAITMGASSVVMAPAPEITFVVPPKNYGKLIAFNFGGVADFEHGDPFIDMFLSARAPNMKVRHVNPFHDPALLDQDANGFQLTCTDGQDLNYVIVTNSKGSRPSGTYVLTYLGGTWPTALADITMEGGTIVSHVQGRLVFTWDGVSDLFLRIRPTDPGGMTALNYAYGFRILFQDDEAGYDPLVNIWRPEILAEATGSSWMRALNWAQVNHSPLEVWADRPVPTIANCNIERESQKYPGTWRRIGMPYEWIIDFCNKAGCDLYLPTPHRIDNAYVTQMATLIRDNLNPELRWHAEYSSETWNPLFEQQAYVADVLFARYGLTAEGDAWNRARATRSCEVFSLIEDVFAGQMQRVVRILGGQSTVPNMVNEMAGADVSIATSPTLEGFAADSLRRKFDKYAIAPYGGKDVDESTAEAALAAMVAELDVLFDPVTGEVAQNYANLQAINPELGLIAYEGGQELRVAGHPNMTEEIVNETNRLPGMRGYMEDYCTRFTNITGDAMGIFVLVGAPSSAGAFGFSETYAGLTSPPGPENYKLYGWRDFIATLPVDAISVTADAPGTVSMVHSIPGSLPGSVSMVSEIEFAARMSSSMDLPIGAPPVPILPSKRPVLQLEETGRKMLCRVLWDGAPKNLSKAKSKAAVIVDPKGGEHVRRVSFETDGTDGVIFVVMDDSLPDIRGDWQLQAELDLPEFKGRTAVGWFTRAYNAS